MAESSWPGPGPATVTEHQHELLWAGYPQSGLVGDPSLPDLVFADSTGRQVKVRPDRYAVLQGQVWASGDTELIVPLSENTSGSTRVDRLVLRLDRSTWLVTVEVKEGTPGSGPPSDTRDFGPSGVWEMVIADVTVRDGVSTINPSDVRAWQTYLAPQPIVANQGVGALLNRSNILRYAPDTDELMFHRSTASGDRMLLWSDTGEIQLSDQLSGWERSGNPSTIQRMGNVVLLRYGEFRRTGGNVSTVSGAVRMPGLIPAALRHPRRHQYQSVRRGGDGLSVNMRITHAASDNPGQIEISRGDVANGESISPFSIVWLVSD